MLAAPYENKRIFELEFEENSMENDLNIEISRENFQVTFIPTRTPIDS